MNYKALMLDVDGTLIPNKRNGMPSPRVTEAINKASSHIHIGIATSRPLFLVKHLFEHLRLTGPSIVSGGARIVDANTHEIHHEQLIAQEDIKHLYQIANKLQLPLYADREEEEVLVTHDTIPTEALGMYIPSLAEAVADAFLITLTDRKNLSVHKVPAWDKGKFSLTFSHASATKQHGILEVAKILGITTHDIIGVGDGGNDFPLLMACGLKIAMGNAADDLKAIADYVAPSVDDDGVAEVIEKYILK